MYRVRDLKNGLYQIHKKNGPAYEGTPRSVFYQAIKMGVDERDLAKAVTLLQNEGYDYADFEKTGKFLAMYRNRR